MTDIKIFDRSPLLAVDFETYDLDEPDLFDNGGYQKHTIKIFSVATKIQGKYYKGAYRKEDFKLFWNKNRDKKIIFHNSKYDLKCIKKAGFEIESLDYEDTIIMAHLLDEQRLKGLKELRQSVLNLPGRDKYKDTKEYDWNRFLEYAELDAEDTYKLYEIFKKDIERENLETVYQLELLAVLPTIEMEESGCKIDTDLLLLQQGLLKTELDKIKGKCSQDWGDVNLNSPKQIEDMLYTKLGYPVNKNWVKSTGSIATDKLALLTIAKNSDYPQAQKFANDLRAFRKLDIIYKTFNIGLLEKIENGRLHCEFNQIGTVGSRYSSKNPNLENMPAIPFIKEDLNTSIRKLFISEKGKILVDADYSQLELRVMAELSRDKNMLKAFLDKIDIHQMTADLIKIERKPAKQVNFGIGYGLTAYGLTNNLFEAGIIVDEQTAQYYIDRFWLAYPKVKLLFNYIDEGVKKHHFVRDILGRKRRWGEINKGTFREAHNFVIQSTAGELAKMALVKLYKMKNHKKAKFINIIHDEILSEVDEDYANEYAQLKKYCMESVMKTKVPIIAEPGIGKNWLEAK